MSSRLQFLTAFRDLQNEALFLASAMGYADVVEEVLTAMQTEIPSSNVRKLLVDRVDGSTGHTALIVAAHGGYQRVATLLIDAGANVGMQNENGSTALFVAALHGHADMVRYFAVLGADTAVVNDEGYTPLMAACSAGQGAVVEALLRLWNRQAHKEINVINTVGDEPGCNNTMLSMARAFRLRLCTKLI